MRRQPTVSDVASAAGVSRQTVSNVLNSPEIVKPETRDRVRHAIADLGYRPHASARRLRTRTSATIGVRLDPGVDGMAGSLLDRFLHALVERADALQLRVLLYTAADEQSELDVIDRLLEGADVDALVLTSTHYGDRRIDWLMEREVRFVTFGRPWDTSGPADAEHLWVDVDGRSGVADATRHLLGRGCRRIAFLGWPAGSGTGDDRRAGWRDEMRAAGVPEAELDGLDLALEEDPADGTAAARLVARLAPEPEAVVCASDSLALGAWLAIGERATVMGYDDTPVARALGFSSIAQPLAEVAAQALELLTEPPAPGEQRHRLLAPSLVLRGTAGGA
ncbi:LacI family DNA-binding transcriptional regulator [Amnibacterium endophyticum]|uniref:LacI family DNA-binding transcriptional regulator n=1 Tax=Amnibacterium endophyticum TaxID=2109337 RepID=A0ABW4LF17_9MICO